MSTNCTDPSNELTDSRPGSPQPAYSASSSALAGTSRHRPTEHVFAFIWVRPRRQVRGTKDLTAVTGVRSRKPTVLDIQPSYNVVRHLHLTNANRNTVFIWPSMSFISWRPHHSVRFFGHSK